MLKMVDIKKMDKTAIVAKVAELKKELFQTKFQKHTTGIEKPHMLKATRRDIARLLTAFNANK